MCVRERREREQGKADYFIHLKFTYLMSVFFPRPQVTQCRV